MAAPQDAEAPNPAAARHVFVYGTLRAGGSNDIRRYSPPPCRIGNASIAGTLYDFGSWPGLRLHGSGIVVGEVWRIDPGIEPLLDELEGVRADGNGEYARRTVSIDVAGRPITCLVYEIRADRVQGRSVIANGDWIVHALGQ